MAGNNLKRAARKHRHEQRRKTRRKEYAKEREAIKKRNQRMRKLFMEGRREDLKIRRGAKNYVRELENEIENDKA